MEEKFEALVQGIVEHNYATLPNFFSEELIAGLRNNLHHRYEWGLMHPAGVGKQATYQKNLKVRGDVISWIDENDPDEYEQAFFDIIQSFYQYLNRTCYTGINGFEFHYALYETGSFYKRHLDQFQHDRGRRFSVVTYLNDDWSAADGGQLILYLGHEEKIILPEGGRVVFFKADAIEHEVKLASKDRMSIPGWLLSL
jgi:SM-20-related protein